MPVDGVVASHVAMGRKVRSNHRRAHAQSLDEWQTIALGIGRHEDAFRVAHQTSQGGTGQSLCEYNVVLELPAAREKMLDRVPAPSWRTYHDEFWRSRTAPADQFAPNIDEKRMIFALLERAANNKIAM